MKPSSDSVTGMLSRLNGRVALVTGGASGIGRGTARRLALEGAAVVIADVQTEMANEFCAELSAAGFKARVAECDVAREDDVERAVATAVGAYGRLDILVNVAGGSSPRKMTVEEMPMGEFNRVLMLNVTGTMLCIKHAVPAMRRQNHGRIINVTSTAAFLTSDRTTVAYASAKAAITGLTRQLVFDYSRFGITVNAVAPGHIKTPIALRLGEALFNERIALIPAGRLGEPEDVAASIAFLASDEASFVNGQVLMVDGGQSVCMNYAGAGH